MMVETRRHLARQYYVNLPTGTRPHLKCSGTYCEWESDYTDSLDAQREAHRVHRRSQGEHVPPAKLTQSERLKAIGALHTAVTANVQVTLEGVVTRGDVCTVCTKPWPCDTTRLVSGERITA